MLVSSDPLLSHAQALKEARHGDPFAVLGPHVLTREDGPAVAVRVWQPRAQRVELVPRDLLLPADPILLDARLVPGFFEAIVQGVDHVFDYRLRVWLGDTMVEMDDPYRFGMLLGELDLHLLGEGTHYRAYRWLGAHPRVVGEVAGTYFAVWAPNATRVSVVGDFNGWDGRVHPLRFHAPIGVWEIFLPGHHEGQRYKFEMRAPSGQVFLKADPYGTFFETPPSTASIVWPLDGYAWRDQSWIERRQAAHGWFDRPVSIYEVHLGSWRRRRELGNRSLSYRELAADLVPYVVEMGYTHIELLPVMEHPFYGSWGYQVIGFFAPTSRYGPPEDFKYFVDECHRAGIGVLLDWVPGHFPKDAHGLARFDGTALYEHADPRQGEHQDWGTLVFNYSRNEVRNFLLTNAVYWLDEFHIDGLRVDAVASMLYLDYSRREGQWVPNRFGGRENIEAVEFLRQLNALTHQDCPGTITIAEESTAWPAVSKPVYIGGLGFSYKWNMGWMHDILKYMSKDPVFRKWEHNHLTFSMLYAYNENFILPFSHDEIVYGKGSMMRKMPGDAWRRAANLRALYGFMFTHPGKKLMFMGCEFGQWNEWNHDDQLSWELLAEPLHEGLRGFVRDLNRIYREEPSLSQCDYDPAGFQWIDCSDSENSVVSFYRTAADERNRVIVVLNFTPIVRAEYRVGVPEPGHYRELLNSDAAVYGGSNVGNSGGADTQPVEAHGHQQSLALTLPPLSVLLLKRDPTPAESAFAPATSEATES